MLPVQELISSLLYSGGCCSKVPLISSVFPCKADYRLSIDSKGKWFEFDFWGICCDVIFFQKFQCFFGSTKSWSMQVASISDPWRIISSLIQGMNGYYFLFVDKQNPPVCFPGEIWFWLRHWCGLFWARGFVEPPRQIVKKSVDHFYWFFYNREAGNNFVRAKRLETGNENILLIKLSGQETSLFKISSCKFSSWLHQYIFVAEW